MDVPQKVERQIIVDRYAVKTGAIVVGVRHDRACTNLDKQERRHHQKIFSDAFLTWCQRLKFCQCGIHWRVVWVVQVELIYEYYQAEGKKRETETDPGPTEGVGGGRVADQRFKWPVFRPGPGHARASRDSGQRREYQEIRRLPCQLRREAIGRRPSR